MSCQLCFFSIPWHRPTAFTVLARVWYRVIIGLEQRQIKLHRAILLICKSTSFGHQRLATLCTFCLSINTLIGLQRRMRSTVHPNGEGKIPVTNKYFSFKELCSCSWDMFVYIQMSYLCHRLHFMKRKNSRAAATTWAVNVPTCTHTSTAATPSGWRVACGWSMRNPATRVSNTSWALGSIPTASSGWPSTTVSNPAAPWRM